MSGVRNLSVAELAERLAEGGEALRFLDVRTPGEWEIARIEGFRLLDAALAEAVAGLERDCELVFLCHHGMRSEAAATHFAGLGFTNVWNVVGGIDAWSREVDAAVPRY